MRGKDGAVRVYGAWKAAVAMPSVQGERRSYAHGQLGAVVATAEKRMAPAYGESLCALSAVAGQSPDGISCLAGD